MGRSGFLPRLESVRGIAAVVVVVYHVIALYGDISGSGMVAVVVFFVLSGFVLARSLERDCDAARFARRRFFRLVPPAAAVVALLACLHWRFGFYVGYEGSFDPFNVLLNALLVRSDLNGVMWSLTVEAFAAPFVFGAFWLLRSRGVGPLVAIIVVLFGLSFWGPYVHLLGGFTNLAPFYAFLLGVLAHERGELAVRALGAKTELLLALIAVGVLAWCGLKKQTAPIILVESCLATVLVLLVAFGQRRSIFAFLDLALVRSYGRISYSFYMLHPVGMSLAAMLLSEAPWWSMLACSIGLTTPMAWANWRFVEVPSMGLARAPGHSRKPV